MRYSFDTFYSNFRRSVPVMSLLIVMFAGVPTAQADDSVTTGDDDASARFSGFLSAIAGKVIDGSYDGKATAYNYQCPCYVADWGNGGVYRSNWSFEPETHAGVQLDLSLNKNISATVQVTTRGPKTAPEFQYAFLNYKIDGNWNVHAGRERIPLYYYSDFQDLGVAYPWVSPPSEVYGWEVINYNGASVHYKGVIDGISANAQIYGGREHVNDAAEVDFVSFSPITFGPVKGNATWKDIVGVETELTHGFWNIHANFMTALNSWDDSSGNNLVTQRLKVYGIAANLDFDDWFIVSETGMFERNDYLYGYTERSPSYSVGVGYRYEQWTPLINYAKYLDYYSYQTPQPGGLQPQFPNGGWGATLRYDINPKSDLKIQYDKFQDYGNPFIFTGNAKVVRMSYDVVF